MSEKMFEKFDAYLILSETNRFYFTGFNSSFGCVLIGQDKKVFITDARYLSDAVKACPDFEVVASSGAALFETAAKALKSMQANVVGFEDDYVTVAVFDKIKAFLTGFSLKPAAQELNDLRLIKTDDEIAKIAESEAITYRALGKVIPFIKPGVTEKEISDQLTYFMLSGGAEALAFSNIVCFGANGAVPHHTPSHLKKLDKNESVLIDIGAKFKGYCGDMTRTFVIGTPQEKIAKIHGIVLAAQNYALEHIKAGITCHEAHTYAAEYIAAHGYGEQFTHTLGHGVGIDVHEGLRVGPNDQTVLKENMVITVEPGIYLEGIGGVRIEDLVVVKDGGLVNLTNFSKNIIL